MTQESQPGPTRGQSQSRLPAFSRRRARRGGESGFGRFGHQMGHGGHRGGAEDEPRLLVESVGVGVAGADGGELFCGCRSSIARRIAFQCVEERGKGLGGRYALRGVGWTLQGDHLVTGVSSTASSGGGAFRSSRGRRLRQSNEEGKRGKQWRSSQ